MKRTSQIVICPTCDHIQEEHDVVAGDKFAWQCRACSVVVEDGKPHALEADARFCWPRDGGGNVCIGVGGKAGQVAHRTSK